MKLAATQYGMGAVMRMVPAFVSIYWSFTTSDAAVLVSMNRDLDLHMEIAGNAEYSCSHI